ncbi:thioredoxin-disulfide reductase [Treponema sp. OMZ 840]|uniref:thioredoxin-disulfide reductase n=1 Tax=Treponema sp. OMZ 840 TaxID=244313 RepID=UPI003D8B56E2
MIYDVVIIGGGPGGYTAALYCVRAGLSALLLEKLSPGGQMAVTSVIDNYPGFENGIDGFDLGQKMKACADRFGAKTLLAQVFSVDLKSDIKKIESSEGVFEAKTVVIATGASPRKLGLKEEDSLAGRGIAYCATCDGMFFKNKTVAVIGGGNSAVEDALYLSNICKKVYLIHRRNELRAASVYGSALEKAERIEIVWNAVVKKVLHENVVTGITVEDTVSGKLSDIACDGVFVAVGRIPNTELVKDVLKTDASGYIIADETTRTDIPGVFAVGDVRTKPLRQIVNACADGACASKFIEEYIRTGNI